MMDQTLNILYPRTIDYQTPFFQRPNQLMRAWARMGHQCFWLDVNYYHPRPAGVEEVEPNLYLCTRVVPPIPRPLVYYFTFPPHVHSIPQFEPDYVIFDAIDAPTGEFSHWAPDWESSVKAADLVTASSKKLYNRAMEALYGRAVPLEKIAVGERRTMARYGVATHEMGRTYPVQTALPSKVLYIPNACDYDHFQAAGKNWECPAELKNLPRPIIGFYGMLASWLDWELIDYLAESLPEATILLIGLVACNAQELPQRANLRYLPPVPYSALPRYLHFFDVAINPFKLTPMTKAADPIKVWEYLAGGKPVVSSPLPDLVGRPGVHTAQDKEEFVKVVRRLIGFGGLRHTNTGEVQEFARQNTWDVRARILANVKIPT